MINPFDYFAHEEAYADLDLEAAYMHLSAAIRCSTVYTTPEDTDFSQFSDLLHLITTAYPVLMKHAELTQVGHSLLFEIKGARSSKPGVLLLAHQDVVPAADGDMWSYPPFSGHIDHEWIWGRGALDIKDMLIAELEAVVYLLDHKGRPQRDIVLAFGEDEEVRSTGATALAAYLANKNAHFAFSLDEGVTTFADASPFGAPGLLISDIGLSQKGFLNVRLEAHGEGGHSSNPFGKTSLERLSVALSELSCAQMPARLTDPVMDCFYELAPYMSKEPFKSLAADLPDSADELAQKASLLKPLFPLVKDTMSVNQIIGSAAAANVMPKDVYARINFRLLPGTTDADILSWIRSTVTDPDISIIQEHYTPAGRIDSLSGEGYRVLKEAFDYFYPGTLTVPSLVCGGTDSIRYESVCDTLLRICPFRPSPEEFARGVHGTNERVSKRVYAQGIRVIIRLLENSVF